MTLKEKVIAHWQRMHDDAPGCRRNNEFLGSTDCAFCVRYKSGFQECGNCPIRKKTGEPNCNKSPYKDAHRAYSAYQESGWDEFCKMAWQAFAENMIIFLEGLPDGE